MRTDPQSPRRLRRELSLWGAIGISVALMAPSMAANTLYRNVWPVQDGAARWFPVVTAVWILLAVGYVLVRPGMSRRVGERLTVEEGLAPRPGTAAR